MEFTKNKKVVFCYKKNPIFKVGTIININTIAFKDIYTIKGEDNVLYYDITTDSADDSYINIKLTETILKDDIPIPENKPTEEEDYHPFTDIDDDEPTEEDDYHTFTNIDDDDESNMNLYE